MVLALLLAGCAAPAAAPEETPGELDEMARRLRGMRVELEGQRRAHADDLYRLAERSYSRGEFEQASVDCDKALVLVPDHLAAQALRLELTFLLEKAGPTRVVTVCPGPSIAWTQVLLELDGQLEAAARAHNAGEQEAVIEASRRVLETLKWIPGGGEVEERRARATAMLERAKAEKGHRGTENTEKK
jgi:hypothetical protein